MLSAPVELMLERETVLAMVDKGASVMDIAYHFSTYPAVVERLLKQWKHKPKDYAKPATTKQRASGGRKTVKVKALIRAIENGEVDAMCEAGETLTGIAYRFGVAHATVSEKLRTVVRRKPGDVDKRLIPGKKYGDLIFEKEVRGKARMFQFRHCRGHWVETFTEFQWRERTA